MSEENLDNPIISCLFYDFGHGIFARSLRQDEVD
jgi:hypothetical protein